MEKAKTGIDTENLIAIGVATFLLLTFIDINLIETIERIAYYLGIPVATAYMFNIMIKELDEDKNQMLTNLLVFVVSALLLVLFINSSINERKIMDACSDGDQDACLSLDTGFDY